VARIRSTSDLDSIHKGSIRHRRAVETADICGCFYCRSVFRPSEILDWVDEEPNTLIGQTALCPRCGIDAVIAGSPRMPITDELLQAMYVRFFT
jgi:hypothetical protein